jgi:hypothetical protein
MITHIADPVALNHKPVLAAESNDCADARHPNRSNRRSGLAVRSPRLRPVPGTARAEVIDQAHSHPVEVEIISEQELIILVQIL